MATVQLLSDDQLSAEAQAVFADICETRQSDFVNNFWRTVAHDDGDRGCCRSVSLWRPGDALASEIA